MVSMFIIRGYVLLRAISNVKLSFWGNNEKITAYLGCRHRTRGQECVNTLYGLLYNNGQLFMTFYRGYVGSDLL